MYITFEQLDSSVRGYLNAAPPSLLTPEIMLDATNAAIAHWCDEIRYPKKKATLNILATFASASTSSLRILDIEAVYLSGARLVALSREDIDQLAEGSALVNSTSEAVGYFYNEYENLITLYSSGGVCVQQVATTIEVFYSALPTLITGMSNLVDVPEPYCWDLQHYIGAIFHSRRHDQAGQEKEEKLWEAALQKALARKQSGKRDIPKQFRDGMATSRQRFIDLY